MSRKRAAFRLADRTASRGERPARTRSARSSCRLKPGTAYGWFASVPARSDAPARSCPQSDATGARRAVSTPPRRRLRSSAAPGPAATTRARRRGCISAVDLPSVPPGLRSRGHRRRAWASARFRCGRIGRTDPRLSAHRTLPRRASLFSDRCPRRMHFPLLFIANGITAVRVFSVPLRASRRCPFTGLRGRVTRRFKKPVHIARSRLRPSRRLRPFKSSRHHRIGMQLTLANHCADMAWRFGCRRKKPLRSRASPNDVVGPHFEPNSERRWGQSQGHL